METLTHVKSGMWVSRPGLGLETDQDHFFEVLVLVLVSDSLVLITSLCKMETLEQIDT